MFCKIRKGKSGYAIYLCDRKRVSGKVVSKDIKICSYGWHSLYEIDEEYNGLIEDIPNSLIKHIRIYLKNYEAKLTDVVNKLIEVKKEYYTTYKEESIKLNLKYEDEKKKKAELRLKEYEEFKEKFRNLHYNEIMEKYNEGYNNGFIEGASQMSNKYNTGSLDMNENEKKLLKEAFKLLAMKYHPDKGGNTDKMASINNLKEKIL